MTKTVDKLRAVNVCNHYGFYLLSPYIWYRPTSSRSCTIAAWMVTKRGKNLDDAWYNYGSKAFSSYRDKREALIDAQAWAAEKFGIPNEWSPDPFRGYGPAEFVKQRKKELLAKFAALDPDPLEAP